MKEAFRGKTAAAAPRLGRLSIAIAASLLVAAAVGLAAEPTPIDKIVAVVNDKPILMSEIEEQLMAAQSQQNVDMNDTAQVNQLRRQILDQLVEEHLVFDYATKQGVTIGDAQVEAQVDTIMTNIRGRFPSEEAFTTELSKQGLTLDSLKERYRQEVRRQMTAQRIIDREIRSKVKVTPADVDTFYRNNKTKFGARPAVFHLSHILVRPQPDPNRRAALRQKALEALHKLDTGSDWNEVCSRYSEDSGTAAHGGDLGEVNDGDLDPRFEEAARALQPGKHSGVVETGMGFHIIQLVSRDSTHYHPRHIVIMAQPTKDDEEAARAKAQKARSAAITGTDWNILVNSYSDDPSTKEQGGDLGEIPSTNLPPEYASTLDSLKVGGISRVLQEPNGYHVFKLLDKQPGGQYKLEEIRDKLTSLLTNRKLSEEYDKWIAEVRKKSFVEIKGL